MYKKCGMKPKGAFLFVMVCFLIAFFVGCAQEKNVYDELSDDDKHIVEIVCDNSGQFINFEVDMQVIRFANWNGNMYFIVQDCEKGRDTAYGQISEQWYIIENDSLIETDDYNHLLSSWPGPAYGWSTESPREACAKALKGCITVND